MQNTLASLREIQSLRLSKPTLTPRDRDKVGRLAGNLPESIVTRLNRMLDRGRKGIVALRGRVCSGCRIQVPLSKVLDLRHGEQLQTCESCGRFLYLETDPVDVADSVSA